MLDTPLRTTELSARHRADKNGSDLLPFVTRLRISRDLSKCGAPASSANRRERFQIFMLIVLALGFFASCAAISFGSLQLARYASTSIRLLTSADVGGLQYSQ